MRELQVAIFEDYACENFLPLTHTRPAFDLVCGAATLRSRISNLFRGSEPLLFARNHLAAYLESKEKVHVNRPEMISNATLFLNGLLILTKRLAGALPKVPEGQVGVKEGRLVYACFGPERAREFAAKLSKPFTSLDLSQLERAATSKAEVRDAQLLTYPWEIAKLNAEVLKSDLASMQKSRAGKVHSRAAVLGRRRDLSICSGSVIEPGVVIDTRNGPVHIGPGSTVQSNSLIQGPSYVGSGTRILPFTCIHGGSSVGNRCTVGGCVESSVIHGYSEVRSCFVGHSYVGEWVDLGAMTAVSESKDGYGTVEVNAGGQKVDTGEVKVGAFFGDYVRASAATVIAAGKKIGTASRLHGVVTEDVPSFTVYDKTSGGKPTEAVFESVIEAQRRMFNMRKVEHTAADITLLKSVYDLTREERKAAGMAQTRPSI
ncbi:MAG: hypothetical protein JTT11_04315 [Candidatus Brockarchaeota archaeon]|nr:hypothetical protein [Candidatus Brockarchaeota archaeon]